MEEQDFYSQLRTEILLAFAIKEPKVEDCRRIAIEIFDRYKNYISESTLKRFFGFLPPVPLSAFVLNSLSQALGHSSLEDFISKSSQVVRRTVVE